MTMHPKSRLETDFLRLLNSCERSIADPDGPLSTKNWRLEKYIEGLEDRLEELHKVTACQPSKESLLLFTKKVRTLKGVVEAEKLKSASERSAAVQIMAPVSTSSGMERTQEIFCQTRSKFNNQVRGELFSSTRRGSKTNDNSTSGDVDLVAEHKREMVDKTAEDMIALSRDFKEHLTIAGGVIKKDTQALEGASRTAEDNLASLRSRLAKLSGFVERSFQYWLWITLILVCLSFVPMVVFIRLFPNRSYR